MGDPAGVGPAITVQAWTLLKDDPALAFYVVGAPELYSGACPVRIVSDPSQAMGVFPEALPVLPVGDLPTVAAGRADPATAPAIVSAIETGVGHVLAGQAAGLVTNPINKALLYDAGFRHPGHTEFVAELCRPEGGPHEKAT